MRVLIFIVTFEDHIKTGLRVETWAQAVPREDILIIGDQTEEEFARIAHPHKIRSLDHRRRTRDHQREKLNIVSAMQIAAQWMRGQDFTHVLIAEYDQLPLRRDVIQRLGALMEAAGVDILAHEFQRIDQTNSAYYLNHLAIPGFEEYWETLSVRDEPDTVLKFLGTGSFWRREAWDAVAAFDEPFPMYLEVYLPTMAHHLGYRIADFGAESRYVTGSGDRHREIPAAQREGALFIHPVKTIDRVLTLV